MKILILSTGRGLRPEYVEQLRTKLGLRHSDGMSLVAWQRSGSPLPLSRHLVVGPHLLAGGRGKDQAVELPALVTAPGDGPAVDEGSAVDDGSATDEDVVLKAGTAVEEGSALEQVSALDGALAPQGALVPQAALPTGEPVSEAAAARARQQQAMAMLPAWHPRRVRQAAGWRLRRLKRAASIRTRLRRNPQFRRARNRLSPGASLGFAASCLRAGTVHGMARDADLVIALDTASHRGAWILAKRVPGPDVVVGIPAAQRLLEQRELSALVGHP